MKLFSHRSRAAPVCRIPAAVSLLRLRFYKQYFVRIPGRSIRIEYIVEPDWRLFGVRNLLSILVSGIPGIMALLLAVHEAVAEAGNLVALEQGQYAEEVRTLCAGHPFRAEDGPIELL